MGEIVNLRRVKKQRARAAEAEAAAVNRASFGRTAGEKAEQARAAERRRAAVDQAKIEVAEDQ